MEWFFKYQSIFGNIIIVIGWFVAFWFGTYYLRRTHSYNIEAQKKLFRQEIEYKAYTKIQEVLDEYSSALNEFYVYLIILQGHLKSLQDGLTLRRDWANIHYELSEINTKRNDRFIKFLTIYDSNEIIVYDFNRFKEELAQGWNVLGEAFHEFYALYLVKIGSFSDKIPSKENIDEVKNKIDAINEESSKTVGYIYDFRIEMQNKILGSILNKTVPRRQPGDKSVKVLSLGK